MNIIPVSNNSAITPFKSVFGADKAVTDPTSFQSMFSDAVANLEGLNETKGQDAIALSLGNLDDIGAMQVNSQKAEVALQLLVQMRNKVLEGYQEIMRLNV